MSVKAVIASMANAFSSLPLRFSRASAISSIRIFSLYLWVVIELNVPVFSGDGKVEMIGSDSEHEFPRCDGHVGRILRNNRCKKTDW
ncbi:hypothetical protein LI304_17595 [Salmonella enterica]|uniref:hypothetical protein n=1 Tax=Escherichia coli TaxID=562 RepID=UPI0013570255|nr:hypothetical protein [Escherichia coli]